MKEFKQSPIVTIFLVALTAIIALSTSPASSDRIYERTASVFSHPNAVSNLFPDTPTSGAPITALDSFHFLPPLATASGDPSKFDPSLLNYLIVKVCEANGSDC